MVLEDCHLFAFRPYLCPGKMLCQALLSPFATAYQPSLHPVWVVCVLGFVRFLGSPLVCLWSGVVLWLIVDLLFPLVQYPPRTAWRFGVVVFPLAFDVGIRGIEGPPRCIHSTWEIVPRKK